jgi:hypothetical protein
MSVLVPLYLAGLAALALPVIFHLVRRTPRGRQPFSSLMFLAPTPPQLTRRSRLDQIFLLLLRLTALALLAVAFARPFFREAASLTMGSLPGRRVAILLDTSASMRRSGMWQDAVKQVERELDELTPLDDVALYTFSDRVTPIVEFHKEGAPSIADKPALVRRLLKNLKPSWQGTNLGEALVSVAGDFAAESDVKQLATEPLLVVVSDFQRGSRIEALQNFEWPGQLRFVPRQIAPAKRTSAFARVLAAEEALDSAEIRVRVVNASDSSGDQFFLSWAGGPVKSAAATPRETAVYVPAGESRIVKLPRGDDELEADRIVLRGDDHEFDNTFYVVPPRKQQATLLYVGSDAADDPQGLLYYLRLAVGSDPLRQVEIRPLAAGEEPQPAGTPAPQLVVISRPVEPAQQEALRAYVERGGLLVLVPRDADAAGLLSAFLEDVQVADAAGRPTKDYLLLGQIDFSHPLFAQFASPRYSDFTKIHFWRHRPLMLAGDAATRVIARFDDGAPAVLERSVDKGRILALASGWHPDDSQLALSSKFVPLVGAILDQACGSGEASPSCLVGQPLALERRRDAAAKVVKPDGREVTLAADAAHFAETDQPGIYRLLSGAEETRFAVNLDAAESNTAPLDLEQLEQRGVRFGASLTRAERLARQRQQRDTELESRQKIWRWLIVGMLGVVIVETWWAGRAARTIHRTGTS